MKCIDIDVAKEMIDSSNVIVLDIRDEASFNEAHIPGSIHIHDQNVTDFLNNTDKTKPLMCFCYHGISSRQAANYFESQGFQTVYSVNGGFEGWRAVYPSTNA